MEGREKLTGSQGYWTSQTARANVEKTFKDHQIATMIPGSWYYENGEGMYLPQDDIENNKRMYEGEAQYSREGYLKWDQKNTILIVRNSGAIWLTLSNGDETQRTLGPILVREPKNAWIGIDGRPEREELREITEVGWYVPGAAHPMSTLSGHIQPESAGMAEEYFKGAAESYFPSEVEVESLHVHDGLEDRKDQSGLGVVPKFQGLLPPAGGSFRRFDLQKVEIYAVMRPREEWYEDFPSYRHIEEESPTEQVSKLVPASMALDRGVPLAQQTGNEDKMVLLSEMEAAYALQQKNKPARSRRAAPPPASVLVGSQEKPDYEVLFLSLPLARRAVKRLPKIGRINPQRFKVQLHWGAAFTGETGSVPWKDFYKILEDKEQGRELVSLSIAKKFMILPQDSPETTQDRFSGGVDHCLKKAKEIGFERKTPVGGKPMISSAPPGVGGIVEEAQALLFIEFEQFARNGVCVGVQTGQTELSSADTRRKLQHPIMFGTLAEIVQKTLHSPLSGVESCEHLVALWSAFSTSQFSPIVRLRGVKSEVTSATSGAWAFRFDYDSEGDYALDVVSSSEGEGSDNIFKPVCELSKRDRSCIHKETLVLEKKPPEEHVEEAISILRYLFNPDPAASWPTTASGIPIVNAEKLVDHLLGLASSAPVPKPDGRIVVSLAKEIFRKCKVDSQSLTATNVRFFPLQKVRRETLQGVPMADYNRYRDQVKKFGAVRSAMGAG